MDRLYIITENSNTGASYATMTLGLNSNLFKIISTESDMTVLPPKGIAIKLEPYPTQIRSIAEILKNKGWILYDHTVLNELILRIYQDLLMTNSKYSGYSSLDNIRYKGIDYLTECLHNLGLTEDNGFKFKVTIINNNFAIVDESQLMTVIVNLLKGKIMIDSTKF